jgi:hypothetical protein
MGCDVPSERARWGLPVFPGLHPGLVCVAPSGLGAKSAPSSPSPSPSYNSPTGGGPSWHLSWWGRRGPFRRVRLLKLRAPALPLEWSGGAGSARCDGMRRSFRTRSMGPSGFPGVAPRAGMRRPFGAWGEISSLVPVPLSFLQLPHWRRPVLAPVVVGKAGAIPTRALAEAARSGLAAGEIGWAGSARCDGMRRSFRTRSMGPSGFPGVAPRAGMRRPFGAWGEISSLVPVPLSFL